MKVLVVSLGREGDGLAFALSCVKHGHQVRLWNAPEADPTTGDGFKGIEKVPNWVGSIPWADLVFPTGTRFAERMDAFRERGANIYGPSGASARVAADPTAFLDTADKQGTPFTVSRWMGSQGFIGKFSEAFTYTRLMPGDVGPETDGQGVVLRDVESSVLGDKMLAPLEDALVAMGHLGLVTARCVIDDEGEAWMKALVCHPAFPVFGAMLANQHDHAAWMLDACEGRDTLVRPEGVACGVVLSGLFDRPVPIAGLTDQNRKYLQPRAIRQKMNGTTSWIATGGSVGMVTGMGRSIRQATGRAYRTLHDLSMPDLMYRNDIGASLGDSLTKLRAHGYAMGWSD